MITGPNIPIPQDCIPIIHDNVLYCTLKNSSRENFYLGSVHLETLEREFIPLPVINENRFSFHFVDKDNFYFRGLLAPEEGGLLIQPRDGSESWTVSLKSFPNGNLRLLGTLNNQCYAVIDADWIIRIDLQTRQWEQLSSSRTREGKTPFVDGRRLGEYEVLADPTRERILLLAWSGQFGGFAGGFWAIEKDGTFVPMDLGRHPRRLIGFFDEGTKLLYNCSGLFGIIYDFETNTSSEWIAWQHVDTLAWLLVEDSNPIVGCVWNGYVWWAWNRIRIDNPTETERLPIPETFTDKSSRWRMKFIAPTSDGKHLVVADDNEIVLLRFEEP
jgi:hypothetical protein